MLRRRRLVLAGAASGVLAGRAGAGVTAAAAGFHLPDEAGPHERTFMQWPVSRATYGDAGFLASVQRSIADVVNAIAAFEPVVMLMDRSYQAGARRLLSRAVAIWDIPTDDLWCRDSGPAFVVDGRGGLAVTQFNFNGWGNKQAHGNDGLVAGRVAARLGLPVFDAGLVGEPGGLETDGAGTVIAHESSWVNRNRNAGDRAAVERLMLATTGARKVIWAPGIKGADITDYHIDALARFTAPGKVLIQMGEQIDPDDPWSRAAFATRDVLAAASDAAGRRLALVTLPEPEHPRVRAASFVASYVNYYVCNGAVIAAQFGDRSADARAKATLARLYPGREIVMLDTDPIGESGGGIHCATHEQPRV